MIKTFILIFTISGYHYGGPATAEFQSLEKCEAAIELLDDEFRGFRGICVEK